MRGLLPSHLLAISRRYHRSNVPGVTSVPIPKSPLRPIALALAARRRRLSIGEAQAPFAELLTEHPVLRLQVLDDVLLACD